MAKYKDRKTNKQLLLFGDATEADPASRLASKLTWEGDILANPEALVCRLASDCTTFFPGPLTLSRKQD